VTVTSKVVSKAEARYVDGTRDDALPGETVRVVARRGPTTIVRNRQGLTMAAAGIDASNVTPGRVLLLPEDPDASARRLREAIHARTGTNVGVLVTDTAGRAWREGQTDIAIGAAGVVVAEDYAGRTDGHGNPLLVTAPAVADELAGAAELASGKLGGRPFAVIRGRADLVLPAGDHGTGAAALVRADGADLFGFGAREAVVAALADRDTAVFGSPAEVGDLVRALREVVGAGRVTSPDETDGDELAAYLPDGGPADLHVVEVLARVFGWTVEETGDGGRGLDLRFRRSSP
jgi:coenzyme F420-0:L-glutamate ligase/coenzyme F420-1:gamma-L-glutamate ligase